MVKSFSMVGHYQTALLFMGLLGLMAATLQVVEYAHLHMWPIQWYLKQRWNHVSQELSHRIMVSRDLKQHLQWWSVREPLTRSALFLAQHHHHYHYGCEHGRLSGSTTALYNDLWFQPDHQLHINVLGAQSSSSDPSPSGAGNPRPVNSDQVQQHHQTGRSACQDPQRRGLHSVPVGDPKITQTLGDSSTRHQQRVGKLPVVQSPGPHRVAACSVAGTGPVLDVEKAPSGPVPLAPKPATSPLVLLD